MAKKDPYMLDEEVAQKQKEENQGSSIGEICPKRNLSIGGTCKVCDKVQELFSTKDPGDRELAFKKMAKATYYLNVVFPENPDKLVLMEIGKKAGNIILEGISEKGWTDIAHPKAGKGREMQITKGEEGGYPTYAPSPVLQNADWDIPKEVLDNLYNLDKVISMVQNPDTEIYRLNKEMKKGQTINFRICPPWDNGSGNKRVLAIVWRHWGVTSAEIYGEESIDWSASKEEKDYEKDNDLPFEPDDKKEAKSGKKEEKEEEEEKDEPCLGNESLFDEDDEDCKNCRQFKKCMKMVLKKKK